MNICTKLIATLLLFIIMFTSYSQAPGVYWQKSYGGSTIESRPLVRATRDKGFIMAGFSMSTDGDYSISNSGSFDIYLTKLDSCGNKQWVNSFGSSSQDLVYGLAEIPGNGLYYAGVTFTATLPGYHGGPQDGLVVRTDQQGNILWSKLFGGNSNEVLSNMVVLPDTSCIIGGYTASTDGDGGPVAGTSDAWVIKVDKNGNLLWKKFFGGAGGDAFFDISASNDGGFIAAGYSANTPSDSDFFVVKMDANGNLVWQKTYGGSSLDNARTVRAGAGGGYIAAGTTRSPDGDITGYHGQDDVWVIKLDENGNLL